MASKLKKGDKVFILAGKDKGKEGEIIQILGSDKAIVQGINLVKKHKKTFTGR
jgi:large subunit ribosomal protein L24